MSKTTTTATTMTEAEARQILGERYAEVRELAEQWARRLGRPVAYR
jgi:hypothetical protein